jgi:hypothetical protein
MLKSIMQCIELRSGIPLNLEPVSFTQDNGVQPDECILVRWKWNMDIGHEPRMECITVWNGQILYYYFITHNAQEQSTEKTKNVMILNLSPI